MLDDYEVFERVLFLVAVIAAAVILCDVFIWRP
jgi:hypothetical protein